MRGGDDLPDIDQILTDPTASIWLKSALQSALCRDPVDAANDSETLARLLELRCDRLLGIRTHPRFWQRSAKSCVSEESQNVEKHKQGDPDW